MHKRELKTVPSREEVINATHIMVAACYHRAWNAGWHHDIKTGAPVERNMGEMLALVHSEISEALEGHRKNLMDDKLPHRKMVPIELFDAAIRIFDIIGKYYPDDTEGMVEKLEFNDHRLDHKPENRALKNGKKL